MATFFIIKHRATGKLMPALMRGSTWWEPYDFPGGKKIQVPRLFASRQAAISCVRWWTSGQWQEERHPSSHESFYSDDDSSMVRIEPMRLRKPGDLEIVEVELREVGQMELL